MAQIVKMKDESERIMFGGRHEEINASNITYEKYQWVLKNYPLLEDKFVVIEDVKEDKKAKKE